MCTDQNAVPDTRNLLKILATVVLAYDCVISTTTLISVSSRTPSRTQTACCQHCVRRDTPNWRVVSTVAKCNNSCLSNTIRLRASKGIGSRHLTALPYSYRLRRSLGCRPRHALGRYGVRFLSRNLTGMLLHGEAAANYRGERLAIAELERLYKFAWAHG